MVIEGHDNSLVIHQGPSELMKRYYGNQALGYLRQKQVAAQKKLSTLRTGGFTAEAQVYAKAINPKGKGKEKATSQVGGGTVDEAKGEGENG